MSSAATDRFHLVALLAVAALLALTLGATAFWDAGLGRFVGSRLLSIGGPFALQTVDGRPFTQADVAGAPYAIYFGFTFCPDLCPTTLAQLSAAREGLGERAKPIRLLFVSVDPERDTPALLKDYETAFPGVTALSGDEKALRDAANAFRASFRRVPLEGGGYTVDHTASAFLFEADGDYAGALGHDASDEEAREKLGSLIDPEARPRWRWPAVLGGH